MKRIILGSTVAVLLVLVAVVIVRAETRGPGWYGHRWHHAGPAFFLVHRLHLSRDQRAQIHDLWQAERPAVSTQVHDLLAENKEMDAAARSGTSDAAQIQKIADREAATIATLLVEKEQLESKIYRTVLNADQRTKADALRKRWESHMDRAADRLGTPPAGK